MANTNPQRKKDYIPNVEDDEIEDDFDEGFDEDDFDEDDLDEGDFDEDDDESDAEDFDEDDFDEDDLDEDDFDEDDDENENPTLTAEEIKRLKRYIAAEMAAEAKTKQIDRRDFRGWIGERIRKFIKNRVEALTWENFNEIINIILEELFGGK